MWNICVFCSSFLSVASDPYRAEQCQNATQQWSGSAPNRFKIRTQCFQCVSTIINVQNKWHRVVACNELFRTIKRSIIIRWQGSHNSTPPSFNQLKGHQRVNRLVVMSDLHYDRNSVARHDLFAISWVVKNNCQTCDKMKCYYLFELNRNIKLTIITS